MKRSTNVATYRRETLSTMKISGSCISASLAKNRGADPHAVGAGRDRGLEVGGHPHGQRVELEPLAAHALAQRRESPEPLPRVAGLWRDRHEAAQLESRKLEYCACERHGFRFGNAPLSFFAGLVYLDEHVERRREVR